MTPGQGGSGAWITVNAFPNLTFNDPIHLEGEPTTNRIVVAEHGGKLLVFDNNETVSSSSTFLNISSQTHVYGESGLMGFTFHPRYGIDSNYVYVFYQFDVGSKWYSRLSRFEVPSIPGPANASSELVLMHLYDRKNNHNGGGIFFGNDGYLYLSIGDEGGGNNFYGHGQDIDHRLFGGVFRIDVDRDPTTSHAILRQPQTVDGADASFTANYFIPNSNPFQDPSGGTLEEFFAVGFRNPHRMTYDPPTNQIWLGDVGQNKREEIDIIVSGGNYQWPYREGTVSGPKSQPSSLNGVEQVPVLEYDHGDGISVIGGYVYRGPTHTDITGKYIYADYGSKRLWALDPSDSTTAELMTLSFAPSAFGFDNNNELYILKYGNSGKVYKLDRQTPGAPEPPDSLSATGVFSSLSPLTPESFMVPYELNEPFWSDAAIKSRWMIIPNDGTHNSSAEQIQYSENGEWIFPNGSVLVKHFELPIDDTNPAITKKLETRFLIYGNDGNYYGMTYRWNDAQTEAYLLPDKHTDTLTINTATGNRSLTWYYPSRGECLNCHNSTTEGFLGPNTRQLNGDAFYAETGRTANQLKTLTHLEMFDTDPDTANLGSILTSASSQDLSASLEDRARSYLDANCSSCHQPGTGVDADFDARLDIPLANQGLIFGSVQLDLGIHDSRIIIPGQEERSVLMERLRTVHNDIAMPQLAKNLIDTSGVELISDWIASISPDFGSGLMGQVITFPSLNNKLTSDPSFTLPATSSSGLAISYSISGPATLAGNTVSLTGATGQVTIIAQQTGNGSYDPAPEVAQSFWVSPSGSASGTGVPAIYYDNLDLTTPVLNRTDPTVDFYWGSGRPDPSMNYETFSVKWEGEIEAPYSETFTFTTSSDDGVRLWVNNQLVIDQWNDQEVTEFSGTIAMTAWSRVPIRMEYYQQNVYASAKLEWSSSSLSREVVPTDFLYPPSTSLGPEDIDLSAIQAGNSVQLAWRTTTVDPVNAFRIEHSTDARIFKELLVVSADGDQTSGKEYSAIDELPQLGINYYRIQQLHQDGSVTTSDIQEVKFQPEVELNIFPNPVRQGESYQAVLHWPYEQTVELAVINLAGQTVFLKHLDQTSPGIQSLRVPTADLPKGIYMVVVRTAGIPLNSTKIVIRD
ncbi:MAG: PQQ-dependent sugar dehydrogenase [Bacteroidota bacterium]